MTRKTYKLNPGSQRDFVLGDEAVSAFVGGVGSGKTFAGIARGLRLAQQPVVNNDPPRGVIGNKYFPELKNVILPQVKKVLEGSGLLERFHRQDMKFTLTNGAEIFLLPMDDPDRWRGMEISWVYLDEGRNLTKYAWEVMTGRLRQPGYMHAAFVGTTPNGFDWVFDLFHEDSPARIKDSVWYSASTYDNQPNVGLGYIERMEAQYDGLFFEQEVLGHFIGVMKGGVFPEWHPRYSTDCPYDPHLPLYAGWDFGVSDLGVVVFAQVHHAKKKLPSGSSVMVPHLRFVDCIAQSDWNAIQWAEAYKATCDTHFEGRIPDGSFGDPAGKARNHVTGTSMIQALAALDCKVTAAKKQPPDYSINILKNLMAGGRVSVDTQRCADLVRAFSSHKWAMDVVTGLRMGKDPVHDWTSHYVSAARYMVSSIVSFKDYKKPREVKTAPPPPGTAGHAFNELLKPARESVWLGN